MQFPSGSFTERVVTDVTDDLTNYTITGQLGTLNSCSGDVDMLKKLAAMSSQLNVCKVAGKVVVHLFLLAYSMSLASLIIWIYFSGGGFQQYFVYYLQKSLSEMLASVHHIFLVRTADCVSCSLVMDKSSYAVCIFIYISFCFVLIR
jgi:midasin